MKRILKKLWKLHSWYKARMRTLVLETNWNQEVPVIKKPVGEYKGKRIGHIAHYSVWNAGDILLPRAVRDVVESENDVNWHGFPVRKKVSPVLLREFNNLDGLLIGGGGLFLRDSNPNKLSGWQWSCDIETLNQIQKPMALFAVGYNRFRGQPDFSPVFKKHLKLLTEKSVFIGLRNSGSMKAIKHYLPESLHYKVRFQPCPTTLCQLLYQEICESARKSVKEPFIALNCAFDRIKLRLGEREEEILTNLALAMRELAKSFPIVYFAHLTKDEQILPYLDRLGVPYELVRFSNIHPRDVIRTYSKPSLVIGMRGHAQMIPFGCGVPILSLISHDKMRWFLDDIKKPEWGVEMSSPEFKDKLVTLAIRILEQKDDIVADIHTIQKNFWSITQSNIEDYMKEVQ